MRLAAKTLLRPAQIFAALQQSTRFNEAAFLLLFFSQTAMEV